MKRISLQNLNTPERFDRLWREKHDSGYGYDLERQKLFLKLARPGARVLDLGAGINGFGQLLLERVDPRADVWAVDFSPEAKAIVDGQVPQIKYALCDVLDTPFRDGWFDLVGAGEVIEHMESPSALAREMARVARPGGVLCVTTVNTRSKAAVAHGPYPEHLWEFTPEELLALFSPYGEAAYVEVGNYHAIVCGRSGEPL